MKASSIVMFALVIAFGISGCGTKMTDQKFADVAGTILEKVQANWDHQVNESWATYYERRIAEACAINNTSPGEWDRKMQDVQAHPEKFEKVIDKEILDALLEWERQRVATKEG